MACSCEGGKVHRAANGFESDLLSQLPCKLLGKIDLSILQVDLRFFGKADKLRKEVSKVLFGFHHETIILLTSVNPTIRVVRTSIEMGDQSLHISVSVCGSLAKPWTDVLKRSALATA